MPTSPEKTSEPSPSVPLTARVLLSRHRWERWRGVLLVLFVGLIATLIGLIACHPSLQVPAHVKTVALIWAAGCTITSLAMIAAWRFAPASLADTAQGIDRDLSAKNRLETMAEWRDSDAPLAVAQREETDGYLRQMPAVRPVRALPWLVAGVIALSLVHFALFTAWVAPVLFRPVAPAPPPKPKPAPTASIIWKSPEPESKANPVEEVPTAAVATSSSGLKNLTLEISVNGEAKKSQLLPAQPYDKPGENAVKASLYMDELGVQPYDMVAYYLHAQRIFDQKLPETVSAIQFIEVRPFRDDVVQVPPGSGNGECHALLLKLKLAELRSIKENFVLAHADIAVTDPAWVKENERVGKNQGDLSSKTEEVVQFFIQKGVQAEIVDLVRQAEVPMSDASKKILTVKNNDALPFQQKALSLLVEAEKYFIKIMGDGKGQELLDKPVDPFKDKQQHEMKKRFETAAGQLEQLAKNQAKLARDINSGESKNGANPAETQNGKSGDSPTPTDGASGKKSDAQHGPEATPANGQGDEGKPIPPSTPQAVDPFSPDADKGTLAERQARILQAVKTLLNTNGVLPDTVNQALQDAQKHAGDSLHQLDLGDSDAAREPAASAAQDLQRAVAEMNKAGDQTTQQAMQDAQKQLNDAARLLKEIGKDTPSDAQQKQISDVAAKVQDVQKKTADAADQQQEGGSAQDAQHLNALANEIGRQHVAQDLGDLAKKGIDSAKATAVAQKLEALATEAAHGMNNNAPSPQEVAHLLASLEKTRANLAHLAQKAGGPQDASGQPHQDGKGKGEGEGPKPDGAQGQGQGGGGGGGQKPDDNKGQDDQGKGQGKGEGHGQGDGEGQGQGAGQGSGGGQGTGAGGGISPNGAPTQSGIGTGGPDKQTENDRRGFIEAIADLRDGAQLATGVVPAADAQDLRDKLDNATHGQERDYTKEQIASTYNIIAAPLDKLIRDLTVIVERDKRNDILKQPDLEEAPPAYRPAVSDYFDTMSRDYHPANADAKKP